MTVNITSQVCEVILGVKEDDKKVVKLKAGEVGLEIGRELTKYSIIDGSPSLLADENGNAITFRIVFKRKIINEALMTFLPSMLLVSISYATSFFKLPNFFNTAITVNLTVMLTTTTLLISVTKKLAETSYLKLEEAWLIFAMMVPFSKVILITYKEHLVDMEGRAMDNKVTISDQRSNFCREIVTKICTLYMFENFQLFQVHAFVRKLSEEPTTLSWDKMKVASTIGGAERLH